MIILPAMLQVPETEETPVHRAFLFQYQDLPQFQLIMSVEAKLDITHRPGKKRAGLCHAPFDIHVFTRIMVFSSLS